MKQVAGCGVAAYNVIVQHTFQLPAFAAGKLGQMARAIQPLLLTGNGHEDQRGRKVQFAQSAGALKGDGYAGSVVVGAGRVAFGIQDV